MDETDIFRWAIGLAVIPILVACGQVLFKELFGKSVGSVIDNIRSARRTRRRLEGLREEGKSARMVWGNEQELLSANPTSEDADGLGTLVRKLRVAREKAKTDLQLAEERASRDVDFREEFEKYTSSSWPTRRELHSRIYAIDSRLVELESKLEKAAGLNFLAQPWTREGLRDLKEKQQILEDMPGQRAQTGPQVSEEEQQYNRHRSKRFLDLKNKVADRFKQPILEKVELVKLRREMKAAIRADESLTEEEQEALREEIDDLYVELCSKKNVNIYEES